MNGIAHLLWDTLSNCFFQEFTDIC